MTVADLRAKLANLPDDMVILAATSDGLIHPNSVSPVLCTVWNDGSVYEEYLPELEPDADETRQTFAILIQLA